MSVRPIRSCGISSMRPARAAEVTPNLPAIGSHCITAAEEFLSPEDRVNHFPSALGQATASLLADGSAFLNRQPRDWKVTVVRTSLDKFAYQMAFPYLSIYIIVALVATGTQFGIVISIGMIVAGLRGPIAGGLIDRTGPKQICLLGPDL